MADAFYVDDESGPRNPIGQVLNRTCRFFAVCAGIMLLLMALMSLASIVGRTLFDHPLLGDYELVQMMSAMAVSMALPFCQMIRGHIIVDFFTTSVPARVNRRLDIFASLMMAIFGFVFAWRISLGMISLQSTGDASMLLNLPTWWGYAVMAPSFFLLGCAALYTAWADITGASV
jgi:TRAP-type C4-dicarboxylate transport system permease small subunit